ncbi:MULTISPECIES: 2-amino-4-hydroxy-6-hydroxymethyldihydropteridine diphosphokinase [Virgibacillus]|uniref:2-amino-4-hydroxy-6-hydroxymethyldihydropteridine diphosphokinase n=2 Tax=Virgibacillus TaxID=84406 RepID=A0A024Q5D0_9BACI|nr:MULTISPECIES: 2-amino-4-hydroxy-6-hydroxymethyldihydropteridine diphosphokinase [Virgibacillus]EQB38742.1 hypothetical protein M948_09155 [Virgibacillus sp. CM-4]MYL41457.1 2-amino-4-hydroxy-6-hydroxymethyldihydropteridine diphosphokinase [Virgibacillus massiliensis]GGJ57282.1 2-amino-4-hydroxy-6-hydroxymethyldihydropteridine pyrophosphokinase [Virgibacillus kapii]CDQ37748.1 2-amino-4-hydroxy-6-hydroxymethyldihydropteridinepyrophosphokinase [Virgibacillus massiliensis]
MNKVYLALGTNIEPREQHLESGLRGIMEHPNITVTRQSSIYQTAPVGYTNQADFLNMVIEIETSCSPLALLDYCQTLEQELGRERTIRFGPRTIDLDILLYNQENSKTERLIIPHPRMHERAFVLIPLHEIAPDIVIPEQERRVSELIKKLPGKDIKDVSIWIKNESADE